MFAMNAMDISEQSLAPNVWQIFAISFEENMDLNEKWISKFLIGFV